MYSFEMKSDHDEDVNEDGNGNDDDINNDVK